MRFTHFSEILKTMKTFEVVINRTGFSSHVFEVEAKSRKDAESKGMIAAYNHSFSEHDSDYEVEAILIKRKKNENPNTRRQRG